MGDQGDAGPPRIPYGARPDWQDIQPVRQDEPSTPVVAIDYDDEVVDIMNYFRAVVEKGEMSSRALELTAKVININSADYSAWEYRWECVQALNTDLVGELSYMEHIAAANPKNYQLWNHRRRCALALGPEYAHKELAFAAACLAVDAKNYHAWAHRQAVVQAFELWSEEMEYVEAQIEDDVRNNSAWTQRHFIITHQPQRITGDELLQQEFAYVAPLLKRAPHNESAWNYLRALFSLEGLSNIELAYQQPAWDLTLQVLKVDSCCSPALCMLADMYASQAYAATAQQDSASAGVAARHAQTVFEKLKVADFIRDQYWDFRINEMARIAT